MRKEIVSAPSIELQESSDYGVCFDGVSLWVAPNGDWEYVTQKFSPESAEELECVKLAWETRNSERGWAKILELTNWRGGNVG